MGDESGYPMKPASSEQAVFAEALPRATSEARAAYLDGACGTDTALRGRVEALLRATENAGDFLEQPPAGFSGEADCTRLLSEFSEKPDDRIGRYKLLQQIGEGGCGVVYMAEQEEPVRRRVALKVIKLGMGTKSVIARFEAERQALALMDHPNIAKVFDGGTTQTGRPYFVMELVRGIKITDFCDAARLSTEARLRLFVQVCQAIQHAHQKGIIHRDIKPSNILVTISEPGSPGCPKVIDFGIAKATTGQLLTDKTAFTAFEQFIGTPAYMSPEQAMMTSLDIDTRTDIYALGVLLYELLTGHTPFDATELMAGGLDAMRRIILELEPARPSTRLSTLLAADLTTVAGCRHAEPARLGTLLRGDLDWIVMKALEKDRTRRYETATDLAQDIQRHLDNEPVAARPPGRLYRFQKLFRRNKLGFAAGTAIAAALVVGLAASLWQSSRANREATRARAALGELRATAPAFVEQARALVTREQFDEAIEKLDYAIKLRPDEAAYLVAKGDLLQAQLKLAEATAVYRAVLALAPGHPRAAMNVRLGEELLAAPPAADGKLSRESLARLHSAMQREQRPAAELMPMARLLGEETALLLEYWLARLKGLPISADKPLKERLAVAETGRLVLDLGGTKVADLRALESMPLGVLLLAGCKEVSDLSPLRHLPLRTLDLSGTSVRDLSALRGMTTLAVLNLSNTTITDLSPLHGNSLIDLNLTGCAGVTGISSLRGMPLTRLHLRHTRVLDVSPLQGLPLSFLDLTRIPATEFSPLAGLPLQELNLQNTRVRDLAFLRGMPLKRLYLNGCGGVRNLRVLSELDGLETLLLPVEFRSFPEEEQTGLAALRHHARLRQIGVEFLSGMTISTAQDSATFWRDWDIEQRMTGPLRQAGLREFTLSKFPDGTYLLRLNGQPISDLSVLPPDAPISYLSLVSTKVADLAPVRRFPLKRLNLSGSLVTNLAPLAGLPLEELFIGTTSISDLSPLVGLPLKTIFFDHTKVTDVAPLASIRTLSEILLPSGVTNIATLRALPGLRRISFFQQDSSRAAQTAEEFWKAWDTQSEAKK